MLGKRFINLILILFVASAAKGSEGVKKKIWENHNSYITFIEASKKALIKCPGKIISSLLDKKNGYSFYEINITDPNGEIQKIFVDAKDGQVFTFP